MNIYTDSGKWFVWKDLVRTEFDTRTQAEWFALTGESLSEAEAALAMGVYMAKIETAKAIINTVKTLVTVNDGAGDLVQEYWDPPCNGTFTDEDVAALGITAAQLTACITTLEQAALFMAGSATTPVAHRVTLNAVRRVAG
jgi:hypothetical protein